MCIYEMRASWASATVCACICMHGSPASDARKSYESGNKLVLVQPCSQVSEESRLLRLCVIEPGPTQKDQHSGHSDKSCRVKLGLAKILVGPYDPASPTSSSEHVYTNYETHHFKPFGAIEWWKLWHNGLPWINVGDVWGKYNLFCSCCWFFSWNGLMAQWFMLLIIWFNIRGENFLHIHYILKQKKLLIIKRRTRWIK